MTLRVGFIGLGNMGLPMAHNILKAGFSLLFFNRSKGKGESLIASGAKETSSLSELASSCDIIVSMVSNDAALKEVVKEMFQASKLPAVHISMSTVSPETSDMMEAGHKEKGMLYVAAPVSGRPERAKEGKLWIFLAGESHAKEKVTPILASMSTRVFDLGERPRQASLFKLCNNFMILSLVESFSEALAIFEKNGISAQTASEIWGNSLFDSPVFHSYTPMLCKRNFADGGFALELGLKDMRLLRACADLAQVPMPFLSTLHSKLLTCMNLRREKFDWSAIALVTFEEAGLVPQA